MLYAYLGTMLAGQRAEPQFVYQRLVEIAQNWVIAYNQLGYIAMASGRFVEAEEYFTSYRFVAPDQANPHDSLGELYLLLGRPDVVEVETIPLNADAQDDARIKVYERYAPDRTGTTARTTATACCTCTTGRTSSTRARRS